MSLIKAYITPADLDRHIPWGIRCEIIPDDGDPIAHKNILRSFEELRVLETVSGVLGVELTAYHEMDAASEAAERYGWKLM